MSDTTETTATTDGAGTSPGAGSGAGTQPNASAADAKTLTQADVNAIIAREKTAWRQQQETETARTKAAAAEAAAAQAGEWQSVAEQRKAAADAAEQRATTAQAERDVLAETLEREIKTRAKALPEKMRDLLPTDVPPAQRYAMLVKLEAAVGELAPPASRSTPTGPRGTGGLALAAAGNADAALIEDKRRRIGGL